MLIVKLKFPKNKVEDVATEMANNGWHNLVGYTERGDGLFSSDEVVQIIACPDDHADKVKARFAKFIQS